MHLKNIFYDIKNAKLCLLIHKIFLKPYFVLNVLIIVLTITDTTHNHIILFCGK